DRLSPCLLLHCWRPMPATASAKCFMGEAQERQRAFSRVGGAFQCPSAAKEAIKKGPDPNNVMEAGGNVNTYLKEFIEALKSSKTRSERQIAQKLQKIQAAGKSCCGWTEQDWEPEEEDDFFSNLEYLLRFLNHYALPEETA
uniref:Uncharacterized protein n=1 Tax=Strix occidentalis caurina TaxID=311401 RepID=A0A8D0F9E0_STROC